MRELCGTTDSFRRLRDRSRSGADCLPARLRAEGYRTMGLHGMTEAFYDRRQWWPTVGLDDSRFLEHLTGQAGLGLCGGVFVGICDRDLVAQIFARLQAADAPQFIYWLTLNSHIPVSAEVTRETGCDRSMAPFATDRVCTLGRMWAGIIQDLARGLAEGDRAAPTDILIVGDHAPPLFLPRDRRQFAADVVPWILLQTP
jgi:phosphoglycerol transferase MdoB-like AlkP superfamily enzyme